MQSQLTNRLKLIQNDILQTETENSALKIDLATLKSGENMDSSAVSLLSKKTQFAPEFEILHTLFIKCIDMHTGGEPLRIIDFNSGIPLDIELKNQENVTLLDKRDYMLSNLDHFRKFLMYEPRGHSDMYGIILTKADKNVNADFGVLFMHNEGYSTMCGHAIIGIARYAIDSKMCGLDRNNNNNNMQEREEKSDIIDNKGFEKSKIVRIQTPCGVVTAQVEMDGNGATTGNVSFLSAPGWAEQLDQVLFCIFFCLVCLFVWEVFVIVLVA